MPRRCLGPVSGVLLTAMGCSSLEREPSAESRPPLVRPDPVITQDTLWKGWSAIEQSNGLITLRHVPAAGGRTLSLEFNGDDAFMVFPKDQGRTYPADSRRGSVHFGGHYACIGPERIWSVEDQPFNPHGGPYDVLRETSNPDQHTLVFSSRAGTSKAATVAMQRTITMHRGNTHVIIDEKITNMGAEPLEFYLWDFTQIDTGSRREPGNPLRNITFYLPASPNGKFTSMLAPKPGTLTTLGPPQNVIAVNYAPEQFKIATHPDNWCIAAVDHDSGWTYVKMFDPQPQARYVDNNGPVELYGSSMDKPMGRPFAEMELLTGLRRYLPGEALQQREHWFVTNCKGPVWSVSPVGVVCEPLRASRGDDRSQFGVSVRFGVFYQGSCQLRLVDAVEKTLFAGKPMAVNPCYEFTLTANLPFEPGAASVVLDVFDHRREKVGELARDRL